MIKVKRVEFDFPTTKHFPSTPKDELWEIHFERQFKNNIQLWWDKFKNPDDYKTIDTRHTPIPVHIFTIIKNDKKLGPT